MDPLKRPSFHNRLPPDGGNPTPRDPKPGGRQSRQKRPAGPRRPPGATSPGRAPQGEDPPPAGGGRAKGDPGRREGPREGPKPNPETGQGRPTREPAEPRRARRRPREGGTRREARAEPAERGRSRAEDPPAGGDPRGERPPERGAGPRAGRPSQRARDEASGAAKRQAKPERPRAQPPKAGAGQTAAKGRTEARSTAEARTEGPGNRGRVRAERQSRERPRDPDPGPIGCGAAAPRTPAKPGSWAKPSRAAKRPRPPDCSGAHSWGGTTTPLHGRCVTCAGKKSLKKVSHSGRCESFCLVFAYKSCENPPFWGFTPPLLAIAEKGNLPLTRWQFDGILLEEVVLWPKVRKLRSGCRLVSWRS